MAKINGGIIGPNNPTGPFSAGGVWRLEDAFNAQKAGTWPVVLGYQVPNSLRFDSGSSDYLSKTFGVSPTSRTTMTISCWVKRSNLSGGTTRAVIGTDGNYEAPITFYTDDTLRITGPYDAGQQGIYITNAVYRDVSAWYHIVTQYDTTNATASDRMKLYVNGERITSFSSQTNSNQNNTTTKLLVSGQLSFIGQTGSGAYFPGYIAEVYIIDGQALTPSSFGETDATTGIWIPKAYTGSFGTNGFYLKFANSASLGTDSSGNGNNFTVNNLTSIDQSYDSPTNNFATLNSTIPHSIPILYKEGNTVAYDATANFNSAFSSIGISQGKWYFEAKTSTNNGFVGICKSDGIFPAYSPAYLGQSTLGTNSWGYYADTGNYFHNGSSIAYGASWTNTDIIGCALDLDNNKLYFSKNGVFQNSGVPTSGATGTGAISITSGTYLFGVTKDNESSEMLCNFGYPSYSVTGYADANGFGNFSYAPPSGYYSLCSKNLALYG